MLPKKIKREVDPPAEGGNSYKRPEAEPASANEKNLLKERLAGQHRMMNGESADTSLLDGINRAKWPETPCVDTEPDILPG